VKAENAREVDTAMHNVCFSLQSFDKLHQSWYR